MPLLARSILLFALCIPVVDAAHAADFCISVSPPDSTRYVAKGFRIPRPGKYLPSFDDVSVSTGTACTTSDGTTLRININTSREGVTFNDYVVLPLPGLTGGTLSEVVPQFGDAPILIPGISAAKCAARENPIP